MAGLLQCTMGFLAAVCGCAGASRREEVALVQGTVKLHEVQTAVQDSREGPMAHTELGPIRGVAAKECVIFRKIPYVERPRRFEKAVPKKPWAPQVLDARSFGPGCIGSHTGVPESEDCLNLNIWVPHGGLQNLPVIVYFHGGMNQHGSGQEGFRHGDGVVTSSKYPTIFINFDFRLGLFGWIWGPPGSGVTNNLGFYDQIELLKWVQRNIKAFGGDPRRVTLQGQSEGAGIIMAHMVSPLSAGTFSNVVMHSPPADIWSRQANEERTVFMIKNLGCQRRTWALTLACLRGKDAQRIWNADWVSEELSRSVGSPSWWSNFLGMVKFSIGRDMNSMAGFLGWHAVIDGVSVPEEPRELIRQGKWNRARVLVTISKNESYGVFPGGDVASKTVEIALNTLLKPGDLPFIKPAYRKSFHGVGVGSTTDAQVVHQMITDKMWTCEARSMLDEITSSGGETYLGMFWHSPRFDPVGRSTNAVCEHGATCHAAEMMYVLPQAKSRGVGFPQTKEMVGEEAFSNSYRDSFLAFVHGVADCPWVRYDRKSQPVTFFSSSGRWVVPNYRKPQCDVLDRSVPSTVPAYMQEEHL